MVFFTDRVKSLFFLLSCVPAFLVIFLASIFVLAAPFFTLVLAWRAAASAVLLVLATVFLTLFFAWRALIFTAFLVLAAPFFADLVLGAALGICLAVSCTACIVSPVVVAVCSTARPVLG